MALSDVTVTFNLTQLLGEAFDARRTRAYVKTNVANGTLMDTSTGEIRLGDQKVTVGDDGSGSFTTWAPGADGNPTSWQTSLVVEYPRTGQRDRTVRTFGPYTITASVDLADLEEEQAVPAEYLTTVTAQLDTYVTEAEAARDAAVDISNIAVPDDVVSTLIEGTGGAGPLTRSALSASYGRAVSVAKHLTDGDPATLPAALVAAAAEAGAGGTVFIPKEFGPYTMATGVTLDEISVESDGAVINATTGLGADAALTIHSTAGSFPYMRVGGFKLVGPGSRSIGVATAGGAVGIKITGYAKPTFELPLEVRYFDRGFECANIVGHITWRGVDANNNYYGVYFSSNTYDYNFLAGCVISGNTFANLATPADQGIGRLTFENGHIGYAPYGIYQEPAPAAQGANKVFFSESTLRSARFEQVGNAAIWTDATQDASNQSIAGSLVIEHPGFSWGDEATYRIAARDKTHAVRLTQTSRIISILGGDYPFTSGDGGTSAPIRIEQAGHVSVRLVHLNASAAEVSVAAGSARIAAYARPVEELLEPSGETLLSKATVSYWAPGSASATARRFGGDGSYLYADISSDLRFRNSSSSYALIGRILTGGIIMPKYVLGDAGATGGPTWSQGTGVPSAAEPNGSMYSRTDGGAGTTLYVKESGTAATGWARATPIRASATLDFPSIAAGGSQDLTVTATGAAVNDTVHLGPPTGLTAGLIPFAWVSAADTVTIRLSNITAGAIDPASATWKVAVHQGI